MEKMPSVAVSTYGGMIRREFLISAGQALVSHKHPYDHLSILYSGTVIMTVDGQARALAGPCCVEIKAGVAHHVLALTDCKWDCLHALDLADESRDTLILEGVH